MKMSLIFFLLFSFVFSKLNAQETAFSNPTRQGNFKNQFQSGWVFSDSTTRSYFITQAVSKYVYVIADIEVLNVLGNRPIRVETPRMGLAVMLPFFDDDNISSSIQMNMNGKGYGFLGAVSLENNDNKNIAWTMNMGFEANWQNTPGVDSLSFVTVRSPNEYFINFCAKISDYLYTELEPNFGSHRKPFWDVSLGIELYKDFICMLTISDIGFQPTRSLSLHFIIP